LARSWFGTSFILECAVVLSENEIKELPSQIERLTRNDPDHDPVATPGPIRHERILVAVDGSDGARVALDWGIHLASSQGATLTIAIVLPPEHPFHAMRVTATHPGSAEMWSRLVQDEDAAAKRLLEEHRSEAEAAGVRCSTKLARGSIVKEITKIVEDDRIDLVVVGSHGRRGLERVLLGSTAEGIRDNVDCSVLIARTSPPQRRILIAVDESEASQKAGRVATGLMTATSTWAHVVHVMAPPVSGVDAEGDKKWRSIASELSTELAEVLRFPKGSWVHYDLLVGYPADEILRSAREDDVDLIVMGSRGLSGFVSRIVGSVGRYVSRHAEQSVLIVK
jgi:nucleotide-binding universal stress UspA family protein